LPDREILQDSLLSGLVTTPLLEADPPSMRVSWIAWDSGFRDAPLRVGDHIVAVNGHPITHPPDLQSVQRQLPQMIGQYAEYQTWSELKLKDGSPILLRIRHRRAPGKGWEELEVKGSVRADRVYLNDRDRRILGFGGPDGMASDGFDGAWSYWLEKRVFDWTRVLDGGWQSTMDTRMGLANHLEEKPRVDFLSQHYPGPFARAIASDWDTVRRSLEGDRIDLLPGALDFRQVEEERVQFIREIAMKGWEECFSRNGSSVIPPFPSIDPFRGDRRPVIGKLVALPPIPPRDWIVNAARNYLSVEGDGYWYFAAADQPPLQTTFTAIQRYKKRVSPQIREDIEILGKILPAPRMMVTQRGCVAGFEVEPLAVRVGGALFVDLSIPGGLDRPFQGESELKVKSAPPPPDDADPGTVMETLIQSLKAGDPEVYKTLFADWRAVADDARPIYYAFYPPSPGSQDDDWIRSQRLLMDRVSDIRVRWVGDPRIVIRGDEVPGLPHIEQVSIEIDHCGMFDGECRTFNSVALHRLWTLQRRNGGPWRISSPQSI
jgi:hypothetical protein